jgi:phytoene dehydrogenase-like protein
MNKKIIIIGAGISGLSAGCYGQMNGYLTEIFEMHSIAGGVCTGWKRKGFTIDGCIHWLVGSRDGGFNTIWHELGALQEKKIVNHEIFTKIIDKDGKEFNVYTNADKFESYLKEISPDDSLLIEDFCSNIRLFSSMDVPLKPLKVMNLKEKISLGKEYKPYLSTLKKFKKLTIEDYSKAFKNPFLQKMIPRIFDIPNMPALVLLMTLGHLHHKNAGWPEGGALSFAKSIEERYINLGGIINYNSKVKDIIVKDQKAVGIRLIDGSEHFADVIISAADGYSTIFKMLKGRFTNKKIHQMYDSMTLFPPIIIASFGVNRDFLDEFHNIFYEFSEPIKFGNTKVLGINVKNYSFDSTIAPPGKSVLIVMFNTAYDFWEKLYENKEGYKSEKKQIEKDITYQLEKIYPDIGSDIEMIDIATPMTFVRYTDNWKASYEGWLINTNNFGKKIPKELPGLKEFYHIGQWTEVGGGLPPAGKDGRDIIQILCKKDEKTFQATFPK